MDELKPCPYCGGISESLVMSLQQRQINPDNHFVECYHCGATGPDGWSKNEAIAKWNDRLQLHGEDRL